MSVSLILLIAGVALIFFAAWRLARAADRGDRQNMSIDERRAVDDIYGDRKVKAVSKTPPRLNGR